jgi:hypothetical protein
VITYFIVPGMMIGAIVLGAGSGWLYKHKNAAWQIMQHAGGAVAVYAQKVQGSHSSKQQAVLADEKVQKPDLGSGECRANCSKNPCTNGLTCMAIARDDGTYLYQCLNAKCAPQSQNDQCICANDSLKRSVNR